MRCCICGAPDPDYVTHMGHVGREQSWRARYYCASCWQVLIAWLGGAVTLAEGSEGGPAESQKGAS